MDTVPDQAEFAPYAAALGAAVAQRDTITPELIAALDRVSADPGPYLKHQEHWLHLFAIYLLAQFRETGALNCFIRFFSLPDEQALDLTGDLVTEHGAAVFASVCGANPAPLLRLARDETVNEFVRGQAIDGLMPVDVNCGQESLFSMRGGTNLKANHGLHMDSALTSLSYFPSHWGRVGEAEPWVFAT